MNVLHVVPSYYPATFWGGPIFSTKMICDEVSKQPGCTVEVLTTDSAGPRVSDRVPENSVHLPYPVHFARRFAGRSVAPGLLWHLPAAMRRADVVHLSATYSFPTLPTLLLARMMRKPVVWSPRGAIQATEEWADSPKKRLKGIFHAIALLLCSRQTVLHLTADSELAATVKALPGVRAVVIPNAVDLPPTITREDRAAGESLRLMFLSRLHPKKGLDRLFDAMDRLPEQVSLDVYGGGEPKYVETLQRRAAESGGRIRLKGHVEGAAKAVAFAEADLFVLPTFSENFGIAIAEALAYGLPVLTTTATPWGELESRGCGLCIDPVHGDIVSAVQSLAMGDLRVMGAAGRNWIEQSFSPSAVGKVFRQLYGELHHDTINAGQNP